MLKIGIGGQIGAGKTYIAKRLLNHFRKDSCRTQLIDADQIAWQLYRVDSPLYKKIVRVFGEHILNRQKEIDRKKLAEIVFENRNNLHRLNKIVHPALIKMIKSQMQSEDASVKILDAALLFFWGNKIPVDFRILVTAPLQQKIARMKKRGYNALVTKNRLQNQMQESEMEQFADFVIENNSSITELKKKIKKIYQILKEIK